MECMPVFSLDAMQGERQRCAGCEGVAYCSSKIVVRGITRVAMLDMTVHANLVPVVEGRIPVVGPALNMPDPLHPPPLPLSKQHWVLVQSIFAPWILAVLLC